MSAVVLRHPYATMPPGELGHCPVARATGRHHPGHSPQASRRPPARINSMQFLQMQAVPEGTWSFNATGATTSLHQQRSTSSPRWTAQSFKPLHNGQTSPRAMSGVTEPATGYIEIGGRSPFQSAAPLRGSYGAGGGLHARCPVSLHGFLRRLRHWWKPSGISSTQCLQPPGQ